jgi:hypothetical protein
MKLSSVLAAEALPPGVPPHLPPGRAVIALLKPGALAGLLVFLP